MKTTSLFKPIVTYTMAFLLTNFSTVILAHTAKLEIHTTNAMFSTLAIADKFNRNQMEANVYNYLQKDEVKAELIKHGVSSNEATKRIANLSDKELFELSTQVEQARYGGDVLFTILIVVLIVYFFKRL